MNQQTVLIADDDPAIRTVLTQAISRIGLRVQSTSNVTTLWNWVKAGEGDIIITDVIMPDENIFDVLPQIRERRPELPVIVMSAQNTLMTAVTATEQGAYEYLPKPFDLNELTTIVKRVLSSASRQKKEEEAGSTNSPVPGIPIIGRSAAMQEIYRILARLMNTDLTVMISGESGTGKELVARALHDLGQRTDGPFVAVNMAAIPKDLIESELFGHEKGAFTGAANRMAGRFELAEGGTLFLDEIGDMPFEAQTRLLRVLQEGEFTTVGGRLSKKADVRIVAATNKDLRQLIDDGLFREDLFYRLNVVPIRMPPLRERLEDIPDLVRHLLSQAEQEGLPRKTVDLAGISALKQHNWPGNVRELENLVRRLAALYSDEVITEEIVHNEISSLSEEMTSGGTGSGEDRDSLSQAVQNHLERYFEGHTNGLPPQGLYGRILREVERPLISLSLKATRGNQIKASELLGVNRNTLRKKIRELDIEVVRGVK